MKPAPCSLLRVTPRPVNAVQRPISTDVTSEFEAAALFAMQDGYAIRTDLIRATLNNGCAQLTGCVQWQYQKDGATRCVESLPGVNSVNNMLALQPDVLRFAYQKGHVV